MKDRPAAENPVSELTNRLQELLAGAPQQQHRAQAILQSLTQELDRMNQSSKPQAYDQVKISRHPKRPTSLDLIPVLFDSFMELHGDRCYGDDAAIVSGIARLNGLPVTLIAQQKGRDLEENLKRNFGMAHPEGYRKAKRAMVQAERFGRPVISLIDTPGAYPGIGAEERGQAQAIADNLYLMSGLKVPIVAVIIGEGGSGGALGIGLADRLLMLENAIYSVISPEGCAAILWKDAKRAAQAAEALRITACELSALGIIDDIIPEPAGGAHTDPALSAQNLRQVLPKTLAKLLQLPLAKLLHQRQQRYRRIGLT